MSNYIRKYLLISFVLIALLLTTLGASHTKPAQQHDINNFLCTVQVLCKFDLVKGNKTERDSTGSAVVLSVEQNPAPGGEYVYKLLTCAHVVSPALIYSLPPENYTISINIPITQGAKDLLIDATSYVQLPASLYKHSLEKDLAVLELKTNIVLPTCVLSLSKYYTLDNIFSVSYPQGRGLVVTYGHIQHKWNSRILCTANVFPGSSGGGVFSCSNGKLIGITSNIGVYFVEPFGSTYLITYLHYFIPVEDVIKWLREIKLYA